MPKAPGHCHLFAFVLLLGPLLLPGGGVAGEGGLPETIGPFLRGREPKPGTWLEYRLALPRDPLETRLENEARAAAEASIRERAAALAAAAADNDAPPPAPSRRRRPTRDGGDLSLPENAAAVDLLPPEAPAPAWTVEPLRIVVRSVGADKIGLRLRTRSGVYDMLLPRAGDDAPPAPATLPAADNASAAPPREWTTRVDGRSLTVRILPLAEATADEASGGEVWVLESVPFGLVRLRKPELDLALVGYGEGEAAGFPLMRPDLPDGFPAEDDK